MNNQWKYIFMLLPMWLMVACSDNEPVVVDPSITVYGNHGSLLMESAGGEAAIQFTSTKNWTITSAQSWCTVSPASGSAGMVTVRVKAEENTTPDERNAAIVIRSENISNTVTLTQKQKDALTVTSAKLEVGPGEGEAVIEVKANVDYTCEVDNQAKSWISVVSSRALSASTVKLRIAANEEREKREGKVVVRSGALSETVTVYQEGAKATVVLSKSEYTVGSEESEITLELKSNTDYRMVIPEEVDWITEPEGRAMSSYTHHLLVAANETYDSRSAEICFVNEAENVNEKVKIVQMQKDAIVVAQHEYELDAMTTELNFEVNANVEFEVDCSVDWIRQHTESRALEAYPLSFVVDENLTLDDREGVITISSGDLKQEIKVVQRKRADFGRVSIVHSNWNFIVPSFTGKGLMGTIFWGDGQQENYEAGLSHPFAEQKEYVTTIETWGAEYMVLRNIVDVTEIDLSEF